jgi:hypothetical protein
MTRREGAKSTPISNQNSPSIIQIALC